MKLRDIVLKNRSYRRFDESKPIEKSLLRDLVDLGRLSPSGSNVQPLKYIIAAKTRKETIKSFPVSDGRRLSKIGRGLRKGNGLQRILLFFGTVE